MDISCDLFYWYNYVQQEHVAVANYGTNSVTDNVGLILDHGNGIFPAQTTYPIGCNSYPQYMTTGYFNKDNELNIVIVDSQNDQIHILPRYGNGSFATITTYDAIFESSPFWVAVADFNSNNQLDIVVANYGTNNVLELIDCSIKPSAIMKKGQKVVDDAFVLYNSANVWCIKRNIL
jgi:hypothetical protein